MVNREMEPDRGNPVNRFMHMNATRARASTWGSKQAFQEQPVRRHVRAHSGRYWAFNGLRLCITQMECFTVAL